MALCVDGPGGRAGWVLLFLLPKADTGWAHKRPAGLRSPSWGSGWSFGFQAMVPDNPFQTSWAEEGLH